MVNTWVIFYSLITLRCLFISEAGFFGMKLCEFKGLTNSVNLGWKVIDIKNSGFGKHRLSQISLLYASSSTQSTYQLDTLLIHQECKLGHPTLINCYSNCCMCSYSSSLSRLSRFVVSLFISQFYLLRDWCNALSKARPITRWPGKAWALSPMSRYNLGFCCILFVAGSNDGCVYQQK